MASWVALYTNLDCGRCLSHVGTEGYVLDIGLMDATAVKRIARFIDFDSGALPQFVEIGDEPLTLPPIRVWRRSEILLHEPVRRAEITADTTFRWSPIPGADHYEVVFDKTLTGIRLGTVEVRHRVDTPELRLETVPELLRRMRRKEHDFWTVEAFDADGLRIGITNEADEERLFTLEAQ